MLRTDTLLISPEILSLIATGYHPHCQKLLLRFLRRSGGAPSCFQHPRRRAALRVRPGQESNVRFRRPMHLPIIQATRPGCLGECRG